MSHVDTPTPSVTTTGANCLVIVGLSPDSAIDAPAIASWPKSYDEFQVSVTNPANPYPYGWANIYQAERHVAAPAILPQASFGWDITGPDKKYDGSLTFALALNPGQ